MSRRITLVALVWVLALPAVALGNLPEVIYSTVSSSETSNVPGLSGAKFTEFERPNRSAWSGSGYHYWLMAADTDLASTEDELWLIGNTQGVFGSIEIQEGTETPFGDPGTTWGGTNLDWHAGINASGHYAFVNNLGGSAPSGSDETVLKWDGSYSIIAQEGTMDVPGFPGEPYGSTMNSVSITGGGDVGFRATSTTGGLPSTEDDFLVLGGNVVAQSGVTVPAGGTGDPWQAFDSNDFYASELGGHWLAQGDTSSHFNSDDILVYNGTIEIREETTLEGMTSPVNSISQGILTPEGDWFARGYNDDTSDWVVRNGELLAMTDDLVPGGFAGERFSDALYSSTFFAMTGNGNGDYVYAGTTDNADPDFDAVLVFNNAFVLARQGDPVDLNGDGEFNDDAFIDIFNNDDSFLTDDGWYFFTADLRDGTGADIGQAFLRVLVPEPTSLGLLLVGLLGLARRR